jgi:hypothetical protein
MQDVTDLQQRGNVTDARDSGGRIGPCCKHILSLSLSLPLSLSLSLSLSHTKPLADTPNQELLQLADLSNLALFGVPCEEGDLIVLMTDGTFWHFSPFSLSLFSPFSLSPHHYTIGVHDNLDPQHLGKKPRDMPKSMNLEQVHLLSPSHTHTLSPLNTLSLLSVMIGKTSIQTKQSKPKPYFALHSSRNRCAKQTIAINLTFFCLLLSKRWKVLPHPINFVQHYSIIVSRQLRY